MLFHTVVQHVNVVMQQCAEWFYQILKLFFLNADPLWLEAVAM